MPATLKALIAKTEAAMATETDPAQLRILESKLGIFLARAEMDDDDDDKKKKSDDDDDGGGDEDSKAKKAAKKAEESKKAAEAAKHRARRDEYMKKAAEAEEDAKKCEEDDEEEEEEEAASPSLDRFAFTPSAALDLIEAATGKKGAAAMGAAQALFSLAKETSAKVARIEKTQATEKRAAALAQAKPLCFGKAEQKWLESQPLETIQGFIDMRKAGGPIIHTEEGTLLRPKAEAPGTFEALPDDIRAMIEAAVNAAPPADREALRKALVENHTKSFAASANGIGRY